jgi:hypothetical protein
MIDDALIETIRQDIRTANRRAQARWMVWASPTGEAEMCTIGQCSPTWEQMVWATDLGRMLNREAGMGGQWLLVWTDVEGGAPLAIPNLPTRLVMAWVDKDGDVPFTVDAVDPLSTMAKSGVAHFVAQCVEAHKMYLEQLKSVEISPTQMVNLRKGQPVADPTVVQGAW